MTNKDRQKAVPTVKMDNERALVTEWRFAPGAETGWHMHNMDYIVVPGTSGNLLIESSSGNAVSQLQQGVSYTRSAGVEHNVVNDNDEEFVFVEIELR